MILSCFACRDSTPNRPLMWSSLSLCVSVRGTLNKSSFQRWVELHFAAAEHSIELHHQPGCLLFKIFKNVAFQFLKLFHMGIQMLPQTLSVNSLSKPTMYWKSRKHAFLRSYFLLSWPFRPVETPASVHDPAGSDWQVVLCHSMWTCSMCGF